ncbi:MAG: hypothetical protein ACYTCU_08470 [Planctomycetota bacterium]|jgi:hypothetical protein
MCIGTTVRAVAAGAALLLGSTAPVADEPGFTVELLLTGDASRIVEAEQHLIANDDDWSALWARHVGPDEVNPRTGKAPPAAPEIDFAKQLIVAVFVGRGTSYGLQLVSTTTDDDRVTVRYLDRSYQTASSVRLDSPEERQAAWEERYGHIAAYGFLLLPRTEREIALVQEIRPMGGGEPRLVERARFTPPADRPAGR